VLRGGAPNTPVPGDRPVADLEVLPLALGRAVLGHPLRPHSAPTRAGSRGPLHEPAATRPKPLEPGGDRLAAPSERTLALHAHLKQPILGMGGRQLADVARRKRLAQQLDDRRARERTAHDRRPLASFADTGSMIPPSLRYGATTLCSSTRMLRRTDSAVARSPRPRELSHPGKQRYVAFYSRSAVRDGAS
jgi:hypothetical protein